MAEVEFAGVKFKGGKMVAVIMALSTLGGGLYAGFEFYKDYMNMREKIEKYTAPDLSGFDKGLAVLKADMEALRKEVAVFEKLEENIQISADSARDEAREIKRDLKGEIIRGEKVIESIERRVKDIQDSTRKMIDKENERNDKVRERINNRMDNLDDNLSLKMKNLTDSLNNKIKKALENPLANMRKK